jgi:hypothetical protein
MRLALLHGRSGAERTDVRLAKVQDGLILKCDGVIVTITGIHGIGMEVVGILFVIYPGMVRHAYARYGRYGSISTRQETREQRSKWWMGITKWKLTG